MTTSDDVAELLVHELTRSQALKQKIAIEIITEKFGPEFTYLNQNGNIAIDRRVLRVFRDRTSNRVVWDRSLRGWRLRRPEDPPGRRAN